MHSNWLLRSWLSYTVWFKISSGASKRYRYKTATNTTEKKHCTKYIKNWNFMKELKGVQCVNTWSHGNLQIDNLVLATPYPTWHERMYWHRVWSVHTVLQNYAVKGLQTQDLLYSLRIENRTMLRPMKRTTNHFDSHHKHHVYFILL